MRSLKPTDEWKQVDSNCQCQHCIYCKCADIFLFFSSVDCFVAIYNSCKNMTNVNCFFFSITSRILGKKKFQKALQKGPTTTFSAICIQRPISINVYSSCLHGCNRAYSGLLFSLYRKGFIFAISHMFILGYKIVFWNTNLFGNNCISPSTNALKYQQCLYIVWVTALCYICCDLEFPKVTCGL